MKTDNYKYEEWREVSNYNQKLAVATVKDSKRQNKEDNDTRSVHTNEKFFTTEKFLQNKNRN